MLLIFDEALEDSESSTKGVDNWLVLLLNSPLCLIDSKRYDECLILEWRLFKLFVLFTVVNFGLFDKESVEPAVKWCKLVKVDWNFWIINIF